VWTVRADQWASHSILLVCAYMPVAAAVTAADVASVAAYHRPQGVWTLFRVPQPSRSSSSSSRRQRWQQWRRQQWQRSSSSSRRSWRHQEEGRCWWWWPQACYSSSSSRGRRRGRGGWQQSAAAGSSSSGAQEASYCCPQGVRSCSRQCQLCLCHHTLPGERVIRHFAVRSAVSNMLPA